MEHVTTHYPQYGFMGKRHPASEVIRISASDFVHNVPFIGLIDDHFSLTGTEPAGSDHPESFYVNRFIRSHQRKQYL